MQACSWFNIKCSLYPGHVGGLHQSSCTVLTVSAGSCNWRRESSSAPGGGRLPSLHSCVYASPPSPVFPAHDKAAAETHLGPCSWEGREGRGGREGGERGRSIIKGVAKAFLWYTFPSADFPTIRPACQKWCWRPTWQTPPGESACSVCNRREWRGVQSTVYTGALLPYHTRVALFIPALNDDSMDRISALHIDQTQQWVASLSGPSLTLCTEQCLATSNVT